MTQNIGVSSSQFNYSTVNLGLTPAQEKQLQEDEEAIMKAEQEPNPTKREAELAVAEQKYQLDFTIFTASPPLSQAQINQLKADYEQTVKDSQITDPDELRARLQVDQAKFNIDVLIATKPLTKDQIATLKNDYAELLADSENPNIEERATSMAVAQDRLNLDTTIMTHPNLTQSQIQQLTSDFQKFVEASEISNPDDRRVAMAVAETLLQKDTISMTYNLTPKEQSELDSAYQKMVNDAKNLSGQKRDFQVSYDQQEFELLVIQIEKAHQE